MNELPGHLKEASTRIFHAVVDKDSIELKETLDGLEKYEALMICLATTIELITNHKRLDLVHWLGGEVSEWM